MPQLVGSLLSPEGYVQPVEGLYPPVRPKYVPAKIMRYHLIILHQKSRVLYISSSCNYHHRLFVCLDERWQCATSRSSVATRKIHRQDLKSSIINVVRTAISPPVVALGFNKRWYWLRVLCEVIKRCENNLKRDLPTLAIPLKYLRFFFVFLFFCFSTGLVRLYIAGLPLRSCRTIGAPSVQGSTQCAFFSFLVAAGFEPMYFSLGSEHLIHYPILTPLLIRKRTPYPLPYLDPPRC